MKKQSAVNTAPGLLANIGLLLKRLAKDKYTNIFFHIFSLTLPVMVFEPSIQLNALLLCNRNAHLPEWNRLRKKALKSCRQGIEPFPPKIRRQTHFLARPRFRPPVRRQRRGKTFRRRHPGGFPRKNGDASRRVATRLWPVKLTVP
jgi:hypothetical protein